MSLLLMVKQFYDDSPAVSIKHPNHVKFIMLAPFDIVCTQVLIQLLTKCNFYQPLQFTASYEFCKLSGLLCSYGLYQVWTGDTEVMPCNCNLQVVNNENLLLYCRGSATSFSAHVMRLSDNSGNVCAIWK